jgi:hypothetical protein
MTRSLCVFFAGLGFALTTADSSSPAFADDIVVTNRMHHLRQMEPREWSTFPEKAEAARLELKFEAKAIAGEGCLSLRQQNIKEIWTKMTCRFTTKSVTA